MDEDDVFSTPRRESSRPNDTGSSKSSPWADALATPGRRRYPPPPPSNDGKDSLGEDDWYGHGHPLEGGSVSRRGDHFHQSPAMPPVFSTPPQQPASHSQAYPSSARRENKRDPQPRPDPSDGTPARVLANSALVTPKTRRTTRRYANHTPTYDGSASPEEEERTRVTPLQSNTRSLPASSVVHALESPFALPSSHGTPSKLPRRGRYSQLVGQARRYYSSWFPTTKIGSAPYSRRRKSSFGPSSKILLASFQPHRHRSALRKAGMILAMVTVIFLLARLLYRPGSDNAGQDRAPSSIPSRRAPVTLPTRKWWQPAPQPAASKALGKEQNKRTSFVTPRHTYQELLSLDTPFFPPVSQRILQPDIEVPRPPSVIAIIDCHHYHISTPALQQYLVHLHQQTTPPDEVRIILPSSVQIDNPELYPARPNWASIHPLQDSVPSKTAVRRAMESSALSNLNSDYTLLLACPSFPPSSSSTHRASSEPLTDGLNRAIEAFLRAATSESYAGTALASGGLRTFLRHNDQQEQDAAFLLLLPGVHEHVQSLVSLEESAPVNVPLGALFFQTGSLEGLKDALTDEELESCLDDTVPHSSVLASYAVRFGQTIRALPIPIFALSGHQTPSLSSRILSDLQQNHACQTVLAQRLVSRRRDASEKLDGGPARVAVELSTEQSADDQSAETYPQMWSGLICSFADEDHYGHAIRVFTKASAWVGSSIHECPQVRIEAYDAIAIRNWRPDVLLQDGPPGGRERHIDTDATICSQCTVIRLNLVDLPFLSWLPTLSVDSLQSWHTPQIQLVVISNDRPLSLHRLLTSVRNAAYLSDPISLSVHLEQTADATTSSMLQDAAWPHGPFTLRHRILKAGLMPAVVESWYPANNDSYGVLLEDDVEVSPHFYSWLKYSILRYRYGSEEVRKQARRMFGVSLYQPRNLELRPEGRRPFDTHLLFEGMGVPRTTPYLSQVPCSWGAVYFPEVWRELHDFLILRLSETTMDLNEVIIPDIRSNRWPRSWKRYLNELIYLRGYTMLYPNYDDFVSFSTNHLELGTHVKDDGAAAKRRQSFQVPLMPPERSLLHGLPGARLPRWMQLPILDFWGSLVTQEELLERAALTLDELDLCEVPDGPAGVSGGGAMSEEGQGQLEKVIEAGSDTVESRETKAILSQPSFNAKDLLCPRRLQPRDAPGGERQIPRRAGSRRLAQIRREARVAEREAELEAREARIVEYERTMVRAPWALHDEEEAAGG